MVRPEINLQQLLLLAVLSMAVTMTSCKKEELSAGGDQCDCRVESMRDNLGETVRFHYEEDRLMTIEKFKGEQMILAAVCSLKYDASRNLAEEFVEDLSEGHFRKYVYEYEGNKLMQSSSMFGFAADELSLRLRLKFFYPDGPDPTYFQVFNSDDELLKKVELEYDDSGNVFRRVEELYNRAGEATQVFTVNYRYDDRCNAYRSFPSQLPVNSTSVIYPRPGNNLQYLERYEKTVSTGATTIYIEDYELGYNENGCLESKARIGGAFQEFFFYE